jgi:DNA-binding transcriptional regulator YdaS (Cro superfamily)
MALEHDSDSPLALSVRKAGSQTAFGRLIGKRQSVVHDWLKAETPLPGELVLLVESELGIPRWVLRPDLYPPEEYSQSPGTIQPGDAPPAALLSPSAGGVSAPAAPSRDPLEGFRS